MGRSSSWHFDRHSGERIARLKNVSSTSRIYDRHSERGLILLSDDINSPAKIVDESNGETVGVIPFAHSGSRFSADGPVASCLSLPYLGVWGQVRYVRLFSIRVQANWILNCTNCRSTSMHTSGGQLVVSSFSRGSGFGFAHHQSQPPQHGETRHCSVA